MVPAALDWASQPAMLNRKERGEKDGRKGEKE
jgi:hypothetical protein